MTNRDWAAGINDLRGAQPVPQHLMERQEKAWNERFETLLSMVHSHEARLAKAEDGIAEMRSALPSLLSTFDRFICGQHSNGR